MYVRLWGKHALSNGGGGSWVLVVQVGGHFICRRSKYRPYTMPRQVWWVSWSDCLKGRTGKQSEGLESLFLPDELEGFIDCDLTGVVF